MSNGLFMLILQHNTAGNYNGQLVGCVVNFLPKWAIFNKNIEAKTLQLPLMAFFGSSHSADACSVFIFRINVTQESFYPSFFHLWSLC